MNCYIASGQGAAGFVSVQSRYVNAEYGWLLGLVTRGQFHLEVHFPSVIQNPDAREPGLIAFNNQQVEGSGFQTQVVPVILVDQVAFRFSIAFTEIYDETKCDLVASFVCPNNTTACHLAGRT